MTSRLFVGNLPFRATEDDVRQFFSPRDVVDVSIIKDRKTGKSKGYAFVEMATVHAARDAMEALRGRPLQGRAVRIAEAHERKARHS